MFNRALLNIHYRSCNQYMAKRRSKLELAYSNAEELEYPQKTYSPHSLINIQAKTEPQQEFFNAFFNQTPIIFQAGSAGTGKEQPMSTIVQTPDGPRRFGDLEIGDYVFGGNGKPTKVIGIFPQGIKQVYKVTFSDGSVTRCGIDHLWEVETSKRLKNGNKRIYNLGHIIDTGIFKKNGDLKYKIPLTEPVQYQEKEHEFDPYVIGVLIGDGSLSNGTPLFSCSDIDKEIYYTVNNILSKMGFFLNGRNTGGCMQYSISDQTCHKNRLKNYIKSVGLDVKSKHKFIPREYLYSSVENRIKMLKGLMDTDGSSEGNRIRFSTTSERLSLDIRELIQSLGGIAKVFPRKRIDKSGDEYIEYHVNVKTNFNPFLCKRKAKNWKNPRFNKATRFFASIEPDGFEEQMCIMVDSPDHLYLTDEYIVTHNTLVAIYAALREVYDNDTPYDRLIIVRSAVQSRSIGFLKGTEEEKNESYENIYESMFDDIHKNNKNNYKTLKEKGKVEFHNTSFLRGRTFDRTIALVEEAQNLNYGELYTITTRIGVHSKIIFSGDYKQTDLKGNEKEGFLRFIRVLESMPEAMRKIIYYKPEHIVRSDVVKAFIMADENLKD